MLTQLNAELTKRPGTYPIFELHPVQILAYVDAVWEAWRAALAAKGTTRAPSAPFVGLPQVEVTFASPTAAAPPVATVTLKGALLQALETTVRPTGKAGEVAAATKSALEKLLNAGLATTNGGNLVPVWKHLIYAYLIENTHIVEIMERVIATSLTDETLGPLTPEAHQWLRATEDLLFREGPTSLVGSISSWIRPDLRATRRNAYYRMFAMDLNHGKMDGTPYPYVKPSIANNAFVRTLQDLLRELWRGYTNATNQLGPNTTDESAMGELIDQLQVMLSSRRISDGGGYGNLTREELVSVAMMSWFELSVGDGSPIVSALKATADTREDRLRRVGERAGVPAHAKARSFFLLADELPSLLTSIEAGVYDVNNRQNLRLLYKVPGAIQSSVLTIINQWVIATNVNVKEVSGGAPR